LGIYEIHRTARTDGGRREEAIAVEEGSRTQLGRHISQLLREGLIDLLDQFPLLISQASVPREALTKWQHLGL
jgi:hypothetical protein